MRPPGRKRALEPARYADMAEAQGVVRPFSILVAMPQAARAHLAAVLGIRLGSDQGVPERQAWRIINSDLRGIQARSHGPREQFLPMARNHNWWEIVLAAARRLKLTVYPGLSEREVERLVFEETARRVVRGLGPEELLELDRMATDQPSLTTALANLGLSRDGLRLVLAGFGRLARAGRGGRPPGPLFGERMGALQSLSRALRYVMERFGSLVMAWTSMEAVRRTLGRSRTRLVTVLMALYFHDLLEQGLDEVELLKA